MEGEPFRFEGVPRFSPEHFAVVRSKDPLRRKQVEKGLEQLSEEGTIQIFQQLQMGMRDPIVGVVGALQFEVLQYRIEHEYGAAIALDRLPYAHARWVVGEKFDHRAFDWEGNRQTVQDRDGLPLVLFRDDWALQHAQEKHPELQFLAEAPAAPEVRGGSRRRDGRRAPRHDAVECPRMAKAGASSGAKFFERDLTELAREGRLPAPHGIDEDVLALQALIARGAQHVLLAGEPGVGKTARLHGLARRIALGPEGEPLAGARLLELSLRAFLSRAGKEEEIGESWNTLVERLEALPGVTIVALREASLGLRPHLFGSLSDSLRSSSLRFVLETYPSGAQGFLDVEGGLGDLLHLVTVLEPSAERARAILGQVAADLETQLGMVIDPAACDLTLRLAKKYLLAQHEPGRSVELLRGAVEAASAGKAECLGTEGVLARFCAVSQLPRFLVDDAVPLDLVETETYFNERILGQPEAVKAVLRTLALLKAGLTDPRRPLGLFLCAGPTGVGKTHLARLLAEYVFGSAERLVRVNMADYAEEDDDSQLFGATWQPVREHKRGQLTCLLEGKLFAVLLLDEFEKAHRSRP